MGAMSPGRAVGAGLDIGSTGDLATPLHIHHLGWVVSSIVAARRTFQASVGLSDLGSEDQDWVRIAFLSIGCSMIELLEPLDSSSDLGQYLVTRGEGIHHIAYGVTDVGAALRRAREQGVRLLDEEPRKGARNTMIAFIDPCRPDGLLVEFVQDPPGASRLDHRHP